ncbi:MAG: Hsp70 family protein [Gemmataceae bacterium]|nr:Hsp70 family protein [Gemmataceae bacterium]
MNERGCRAVGIDLGTTYSALAFLDAQGIPRVVPDSSGQAVVPSAIFFDDHEIIVGDIALQQAKLRRDRVVQFIKVHMGDEWRFQVDGQVHTPESLSGIILAHLRREAEPQIGPVPSAVITVPAYFTEKRRRATQQAGEVAGLGVIGTLHEPMAAALSYGLHREQGEQTVLVYDLGGGTFDVTIVRITSNQLEELAIAGNRQLGGKDWDQCLVELVADDFQKEHRIDLRTGPEGLPALQDLHLECERAKRRLSRMAKTSIRLQAFGRDHLVEVTREQFEERTAHLLQATKLTTQLALEDARLRWKQINRVVLVGGSTQMPMVRQMLRDVSGSPPDTGINPVTAVALGAAIYANILETGQGPKAILKGEKTPAAATVDSASYLTSTPQTGDLPRVHFVTAHGVGVKALKQGRWTNAVLIPKNTRVPASAGRQFLTQKKGTRRGTKIRILITQGDTPDADLAEILGVVTVSGIPPREPGGQPVQIQMHFDDQGRLHLRALYVRTGQQLSHSLEVSGGLKEEEVRHYHEFMRKTGLITSPVAPENAWAMPLLEEDDDDDIELLEPIA